jgi:hypothetical protein
MAVGAAVVPLLIRLLGSEGALIVVGLLLPILVALAWRRLSSIDRGIERRDELIALLRRVSFLRLLPMAGIEYLSGGLESVHIPAGSALFSQGDPGDCYYVVASGDVDVVRDGVQVARLGAGDGFGEMALLHDRPRAATILARSELDLRVLDRKRFVTTISRCNASMQAATSLTAGYQRPSPTSADRSE